MSQLLQSLAAVQPAEISSAYIFNGVDMYMTIPAWVPLGLSFSVEIELHALSLDAVTSNVLFSSDGLQTNCRIGPDGLSTFLSYDDIGGTNRLIDYSADAFTNITYAFGWFATAGGTEFRRLGSFAIIQPFISASVNMEGITTIAANGTTFDELFHGAISGVRLTDDSPIQDTWTTASDGVRICTFANNIVIPVIDLFEFNISFIAGPDPLTGFVDLAGHNTLQGALRIYGSTHATFPNQIAVIDNVGNEFRYSGYEVIAEGQHVRLAAVNDKIGILSVTLDGEALALVAAPVTYGDFDITSVGGAASGPLPTGWTVYDLFILNNSSGRTWHYLLNEETGDTATNTGTSIDQDYNGTWTDALGKVFIENNSRFYDFIEGAGAIVRDVLNDTGSTDGTIVNFDNANWFISGFFIRNDVDAPTGFDGGIPYDLEGLVQRAHGAVDDVGAIDHYHQGLPFTLEGRLAVSFNVAVDRVGNGSAPFDVNNRLVMTTAAGHHYNGGVPYDSNSRISVIPDPALVTTVTFDPLETSADWAVVSGGATTPMYSTVDGDLETVFSGPTGTGTDTAYGWMALDLTDLTVRCDIQYIAGAAGAETFYNACRIADTANFIAWECRQGALRVFQRAAAAYTKINGPDANGDFPLPNLGSTVTMKVVGTQITMTINGTDHAATNQTTIVAAGAVGIIARDWDAGDQPLFTNFMAALFAVYDPLESSPNWELLAGNTGPAESIIEDNVETVYSGGLSGSNNDAAYAYQAINAADVEIQSDIQYVSGGGQAQSFYGAVRIVNQNNFLGYIVNNSRIIVWERIAGAYTAFTFPAGTNLPLPTLDSTVILRVVGSQVTITINGVAHVATTQANLLGAGRVGWVRRQWQAGDLPLFRNFQATDLT